MLTTGVPAGAEQVLTTGYWPAYPPAPLKIPKELLDHLEAFEKFYLSKHQGRRLTWQARPRPPPAAPRLPPRPLVRDEGYGTREAVVFRIFHPARLARPPRRPGPGSPAAPATVNVHIGSGPGSPAAPARAPPSTPPFSARSMRAHPLRPPSRPPSISRVLSCRHVSEFKAEFKLPCENSKRCDALLP